MTAVLGFSAPTGGYVLATRRGESIRQLASNALWLALAAGLVATTVTLALQAMFRVLPEPLADLPAWPLLVMVGVQLFTTGLLGEMMVDAGRRIDEDYEAARKLG